EAYAGGTGKVYIYDDYSDAIPDRTYLSPYPNVTTFSLYGARMSTFGDDLLVDVEETGSTNGAILRYDLDSASPLAAQTYVNPDPGVSDHDQFGFVLDSDGTHIFGSAHVGGETVVEMIDGAGNLVRT